MASIHRGLGIRLDARFDVGRDMGLRIAVRGPGAYESRCLGLDAYGGLGDEAYMVSLNRSASPAREIVLEGGDGDWAYTLNLARLPAGIAKLAFTVALDGQGSMREVQSLSVVLGQGDAEIFLDMEGADFAGERALIAVEIRRKDGWRLAAVAGGFDGGLPELLRHYGADGPAPRPLPPPGPPVVGRGLPDGEGEGDWEPVSLDGPRARGAPARPGRPPSRAKFDEEEFVRINFDLSRADHIRLKIFAAQNGCTMADLLRAFVAQLDPADLD